MKKRFSLSAVALLAVVQGSMAQGVAGIDAASSELTTYVDPIGTLIIVIGAIVGLVGGIRVFIKWNSGDQDVQKSIMGWMGSCVFLMLVGVVVRAFFGV
ncbi:uncharacterized protein DUF4134 [Pontibacter ummariensis]|uniref:Uncharacterized protein n=1 Tax=Pontibacter ummariensis TaxID=1610492 RepID=A0A239IZK3_9BACT|nr:DUF4134 domain-containing protein [Pontibacter ummariensis]PRY09045.1 uncharacterized protein DUF4134 [Pontibacter ummariensis]SNS99057.1 protein of unknown function [Pontibacter ummariensis]